MFAKINKSKNQEKNMTAIFDYKDQNPIKTIHFGTENNPDYTRAHHDEEQEKCYI